MKKLSLIFAVCLFFIQPVLADEWLTSNIKYALKRSTEGSYFSVVIALGIVILLIYITGIIYAKLNVFGQKTMKQQYIDLNDTKVLILSSTPIGNNKSLLVVELAGKKMLIGVTNESITLIKDLDEIKKDKKQNNTTIEDSIKGLPLDKIYPQNEEISDIEIESTIPKEDESEKSEYDSEEFGLYKKYLDD